MKLIKNMTFAALALLSVESAYSTPTTIYIAGSNGDRAGTQLGISQILSSGWTFQGINGSTSSTGTLSTATGANFGAWHGYYGGNEYIIKVSFIGALAGDAAVAGNVAQPFVVSNGTGSGAVVSPLTGVLGTDYTLQNADFGFSTVFQATTPFLGVYNGVTYNAVTEEVVGASPLGFYASPGFPGTNITTQLAQQLYATGNLPVSLFTGNYTTDNHKYVYALSRDTDAGQRYGIFAETGTGNSGTITAWQPTITGQITGTGGLKYGGTVNSQILWPAETKNGIYSPTGSGGYSSGALIAQPLTTVLGANAYQGQYTDPDTGTTLYLHSDATAGYYIGYLTPTDANPGVLGTTGVVPSGSRGVALTYNGVALTNANVQNGTYTAWVYNRIIKPTSGLAGLKLTIHDVLRDQIKNTAAAGSGAIALDSNFLVQRFADGGFVTVK